MIKKLLLFSLLLQFQFELYAQINTPTSVVVADLGKITLYPDHTWKVNSVLADSIEGTASAVSCDSILQRKYTQNRSVGHEDLYGVRNMRTVLRGVLYRGGSNNKYNPVCSRDNNNPLPFQMLFSLKSYGFSEAIYLYAKNFDYYYSDTLLEILNKEGFQYASIVPNEDSIAFEILQKVKKHINQPSSGAIYIHCWNGWHMSGLVSAYALMQFCDFNNNQALEYWKSGTDGNHNGYEKVKSRIRNFKKYPELEISISEKMRVCPCIK